MFQNYFKIALRNMARQKLYSGLNILGLAIGLACFLLIYFFVQYERSFDRFYEGGEQIYRIVERQPQNVFMGNDKFAVTPAPLKNALLENFPEVTEATTFSRARMLLNGQEAYFYEEGIWADSNFFDVFSLALVRGDVETILDDAYHMVLTESMAQKIFGDEDPIGKVIRGEQGRDSYSFEVAGIVEDLPENSNLAFDYILPIFAYTSYLRNLDQPTNNSYMTYFRLREGSQPGSLQAKMPAFVRNFVGEESAENYEYIVEALTDVHLYSNVNFDMGEMEGDIRYLYLLSAIGLVILLLACVNYTNLAVARSIKRAREVGLRQVIGAHRRQIAGQFLSESVLMTALALALAIVLVYLFLPVFGELVQRPLRVDWGHPAFLPGLMLLVLIVGLVSGCYPALYMARLAPAHTLKGSVSSGPRRSGLQRVLIVLQFTASIVLIAGSMVIYRQLHFIQQKDVGYNREHVLTIRLQGNMADKIEAVQDRIRQMPDISGVTAVSHLPINVGSSSGIDSWDGNEKEEELTLYSLFAGYEFANIFDLELASGRWFAPEYASDSSGALVLNETAVRAMGWTVDEAIGKQVEDIGQVIGVTNDFHLHSLHLPIAPLMIRIVDSWYGYLVVRILPRDIPRSVDAIQAIVAEETPYPVVPKFLDDEFDALYQSDRLLGLAIGYFTLLAVLIASLGLFGLAAYATERRSKEIGVRKVLGATVMGLVTLLSRDFLAMIGVAIVVAVPLAYFGMQRWLNTFAYRIDPGIGLFLGTAALVIGVALVTVSYQAIKAALADPVKSLRYE